MTKSNTPKSRRNVNSLDKSVDFSEKIKNFITEEELQELFLKGASKTRYPTRNKIIILLMFWHGLRVTELCELGTTSHSW